LAGQAAGIRAAEAVVVVIGHLPAEARGGWAHRAPATMIQLTVKSVRVITQRHNELPQPAQRSRGSTPDRRIRRGCSRADSCGVPSAESWLCVLALVECRQMWSGAADEFRCAVSSRDRVGDIAMQ
jgi:hypothetical protein